MRRNSQYLDNNHNFGKNLIDVLSGITNQQLTCSILVGDFNGILSKWCLSCKDNKAGQDRHIYNNFRLHSNHWSTNTYYKYIVGTLCPPSPHPY